MFAHGTEAYQVRPRSVAAGAGVVLATVALLAWELVVVLRRRAAARPPVPVQ